ncbi:aldose epimerase family protein [Celerinatantimonas diazotrophica]|uniref:Galactose mutarotase-like enzyme n=1 Tax=Celerinatantimonas diazotrophica TaxID=412034 RepID=A0A4V2PRI2_9GAMM|nr:hypothetical protein [Celerinatantimonas diazotrophica]TCK58971.1 galactose mutarotase-like enzyme [Celerinatantimonas diazotrophica]CAG9297606.1 Protein LacX, plasmid [Celerinatantimonas diazotrophica]
MAESYSIENDYLSVEVKPLGAEIVSIWCKQHCVEQMWQGNEWQGRAPILFPNVGNMSQGAYEVAGQTYQLPRHGFARNSYFELREHRSDSITLGLSDDSVTWQNYPYHFNLLVTYRLEHETVQVTFNVTNPQAEDLLFSLGFHPAFAIGSHATVRFERAPHGYYYGDSGTVDFEKQALIPMNGELKLESIDFNRGAIYLRNVQKQKITLRSPCRQLALSIPDVPYIVIWKKPGADFICIEPCFGITTPSHEVILPLEQKPGIITLSSKKAFIAQYNITTM